MIPDYDWNQQLYERDQDNLEITSIKSSQIIVVKIIVFPAGVFDAKKKLYAAIVKNLEKIRELPETISSSSSMNPL